MLAFIVSRISFLDWLSFWILAAAHQHRTGGQAQQRSGERAHADAHTAEGHAVLPPAPSFRPSSREHRLFGFRRSAPFCDDQFAGRPCAVTDGVLWRW